MFDWQVCDTIWNIAPCTNAVAGEPAFLSEEYSNDFDPDLELVTTSGFGKNGAISVLQVGQTMSSNCTEMMLGLVKQSLPVLSMFLCFSLRHRCLHFLNFYMVELSPLHAWRAGRRI